MNYKIKIKNIFGAEFLEICQKFAILLTDWNKVHSMTKAQSQEEIFKNIYDSVYPLKFVKDFQNFADIGTGAGFPGLIISMVKPDIKAYLIESRQKRASFLNFAKNSLGLKNVFVINSRAEDFWIENKIDLITSRAVGDVDLLLQISSHLIGDQSQLLLFKGSSVSEELEKIQQKYEVFDGDENRKYLLIKLEV